MKCTRGLVLCILLLVLTSTAWAQKSSIWTGPRPRAGSVDLGMIVNAPDILLDIEGYQGGVGIKAGLQGFVLRGMLDILVNTGFSPVSVSLQGAFEKHFWLPPVSPYWGGLAEVGFTSLTNRVDEDNWTQYTVVPVSLGAVAGIEIFLFEFLSVFVEYELRVEFAGTVTKSSVAGTLTSDTDFSYKLDLGLGNSSMIGIVIYFLRRH
jgi:hypothetical protein